MAKTHYDILGVSRNASADEIKAAYRKLARQYHPDVNKTPEAEKLFKEINRAYDILSDSLKRADYDQFLKKETYVKEAHVPSEVVLDKALLYAAYGRVAAYVATFGLVATLLELVIWWLGFYIIRPLNIFTWLPGLLAGMGVGFFWGVDANFKIETFLGAGRMARAYTFLRTIVMGIGTAYIFGLIGSLPDQYFFEHLSGWTVVLFLVGLIIGATAGSDGDTIEKISSHEGRFNLLYTALRGIEVGAIGAIVAFLLGLIFLRFGGPLELLKWMTFTGFVIGDLAGSIAPPNLTAYASYASASVRTIIMLLMVLGSLILGITFGTIFGPQLAQIVRTLSESIFGLFTGS